LVTTTEGIKISWKRLDSAASIVYRRCAKSNKTGKGCCERLISERGVDDYFSLTI
jgi:hypothetical protein